MSLLADLFQTSLLILCLIGLSLLSRRAAPEVPFSLHLCFAPLELVLVLFCLEHYLPLGRPTWLWMPFSVLSLWLVVKAGWGLWRESVLWYFLFGFGVCFFWRYLFPDIYATSEQLPDLNHLVSYSAGTQLPAEDMWMKGNKDNTYYIIQYYGAGLIHRAFGTGPGMTYQLGYCTLVGLGIAAFGAGIEALARSLWAGWLAALSISLGGIGTTLVTPFMDVHHNPAPMAAMRFIGSYAKYSGFGPDRYGKGLLDVIGESAYDAPVEFYSYLIMLGDYHPSLSSLLLLGLAILAIGVAERSIPGSLTDKICVTGMIGTVIVCMIANTWMVPLQAGLAGAWLIYRWAIGPRDTWFHLIASGVVIFTLIYPFFSQFAYESRSYPTHIEWSDYRVPFLNWLLAMFPAVIMWGLSLFVVWKDRIARFSALIGLVAMAGTYFFYVHDIYGGEAAIFNTTLKWWPWVFALTLVLSFAAVWPYRLLRPLAIGAILLTLAGSLYIYGSYAYGMPKNHTGRLDGYAWFTDDEHQTAIYDQLKTRPQGVVLESDNPGGADGGASIALFTGHYSLGGWIGHEMLWRGNRMDIDNLRQKQKDFYEGKLEDPASWLRAAAPGGVDYVVWMTRDNDRGLDIWPGINDKLKGEYEWHPTDEYIQSRWGFWVKKK